MTKIILLALATALSGSAMAQTQMAATTPRTPPVAQPQTNIPSGETQLAMVRSALMALSHANLTNNYSVLSTLGSTTFRTSNPPNRLSEAFASFRANRIDLTPLGILQPQQLAPPVVSNGRLRLVGRYPTQPMSVNYDLQFEPEQGQWRLFGLAVNLEKAATPQK